VYIVFVVSIAGAAAYISAHNSAKNAVQSATTHQPETFTELYFLNPSRLPIFAAPGKKQTIRFHIQNDSSQNKTYTYQIVATGSGGTKVSSARVVVAGEQGVTTAYSFTIPKASEQLTITISLEGTQDQLRLRSQS
jgi:electron transfer flavoprotein alpha subunit